MAASLMTFTGQPNAAAKSNPTHPRPRLRGSATGRPWRTGPGYPIDTTSYFQSPASFLTSDTIRLGVSVGPDANARRSCCPVARIFTEVPPTSTTSTFRLGDDLTRPARLAGSIRRKPARRELASTVLARSLEHSGFGIDHAHQVVPGFGERFGAFLLQLVGQPFYVDSFPGELREFLLVVAPVHRHRFTDLAVIGKGFQGGLGHGVHGERCGQQVDVKDIRSLRILDPGAGPKQPLRTGTRIVGAHPARGAQQGKIGLVRALGDS